VKFQHLEEITVGSVIDKDIVALNFKSLSGNGAFDYLLYSDKISRRNDGRLRDGDMRRYAHLSNGGWWCSGIDILTGEDSMWGCFKPDSPRIDENKGKPIKYEHPPKVDTEIFALRVPAKTWELIGRRHDVLVPENYQSLPYSAFWQWVIKNPSLPIIVCEGAKKTAAILSCGYVAIALPGVRGGYRQPRNEYGEVNGAPSLIPQLSVFAQSGRRVYFCFDADVKRTTIRDVNHAISKTAKLLSLRGCEVKILNWLPVLGKGIDDVIAACGRQSLDSYYRDALSLAEWENKQLKRLTYTPDLTLNQRYLGEISIPSGKQLIALKSPKNTGKTHFFQWVTDPVILSGERKVLVITHRVQLGSQICEKLGLPFISELRETEQGSAFGVGLCVDSLHAKSQAKFNPDEWRGCWIILDEIMQLIWHLLSSNTCQKDRVVIIKNFKQLLLNCVNHGGKIFVADADLNDIGLDFINGLMGQSVDSFIVENTFKFNEPWDINLIRSKNPAQLVALLKEKLAKGEKHFVCCSGQKAKSRWGSKDLEAYFKKLFPELRILRIDSKTVVDKNHPAYGCVAKLNEIIRDSEWWEQNTCSVNNPGSSVCHLPILRDCLDYDLVITTPTIETGVSIEIEHFDGVWGIFQGVQTADSVRQHLSRYRPPVPRYVWISSIGINKVGSGSDSIKILLSGEYRKDKANQKKLIELGFEETIEGQFENICLSVWARIGAIVNDGMIHYRERIIADLQEEGHIIIDSSNEDELPSESEVKQVKSEIDENRNEQYLTHRVGVKESESLTDEQFLKLDKQASRTEKEQLEHEKGQIERLYNVDVDVDLIERHDSNWHPKIRLHYFFSIGREFLADRDKNLMSSSLKNGDGDYFMPDTNKSLLGKKIDALDWLNFGELMQFPEISNNHKPAIAFFEKVQKHSYDLKLLLGIDFSKCKTPVEALQRLFGAISYKLPFLRKEGKCKEQVRIYGTPAPEFMRDDEGKLIVVNGSAIPVSDRREEIFTAWVERDTLAREKATAAKLVAPQSIKLVAEIAPIKPVSEIPTLQEIYTQEQKQTSNQKCVVWHFGEWREAVIKSWEHLPEQKFFKATVDFLDGGASRLVWDIGAIAFAV
jgi:Domain of unknown function (DUF3854)